MSLYTLKQLNDRTADFIQMTIDKGYRIDPIEPATDPNKFYARLINNDGDVFVIASEVRDDCFIRSIRNTKAGDVSYSNPVMVKYFRSHDYIYADTREEAKEELNKHYANKLGLDPNKNAVQQLADMLANHITKSFRKGGL